MFKFVNNAVQLNKGVIAKGPTLKPYRIQTNFVAIDIDPMDAEDFANRNLGTIINYETLFGAGGYLAQSE